MNAEEEWLKCMLDSIQADRREMDKYAWQIPAAMFGVCGVVVGVVLRQHPTGGDAPVLVATFFSLAVLVVGAIFQMQRLHERRQYRGDMARERILPLIWGRYTQLKAINPVPSSEDVTSKVGEDGNWSARWLGARSSTAIGIALLVFLAALLSVFGIIQLFPRGCAGCIGLVGVMVSIALALCVFCLHHSPRRRGAHGHTVESPEVPDEQSAGVP